MEHQRAEDRPGRPGNADWFTGEVWLSPAVDAPEPARVRMAVVTFSPGARTNWHTHPLGQTLYVTEGRGRAQTEGGPVVDLAPGDVVWIPPGERHWHGAAPDVAMTHLAVQEELDGSTVDWAEAVSDGDYDG